MTEKPSTESPSTPEATKPPKADEVPKTFRSKPAKPDQTLVEADKIQQANGLTRNAARQQARAKS